MIEIKYAKGFEIEDLGDLKIITLKNPWPGTEKTFKYGIVNEGLYLVSLLIVNLKHFNAPGRHAETIKVRTRPVVLAILGLAILQ